MTRPALSRTLRGVCLHEGVDTVVATQAPARISSAVIAAVPTSPRAPQIDEDALRPFDYRHPAKKVAEVTVP